MLEALIGVGSVWKPLKKEREKQQWTEHATEMNTVKRPKKENHPKPPQIQM